MWVRNIYTGPGGGLYTGPDSNPYMNNWPPANDLIRALEKRGMNRYVEILKKHGFFKKNYAQHRLSHSDSSALRASIAPVA